MLSFSIDIVPKPTPRPRVSPYGYLYNLDWYKDYLENVRYQVKKYTGNYATRDLLTLNVTFRKNIPVSNKRFGDIDNLVKGLLDALTGFAFYDDCQVVYISARKVQSEDEGIDVAIEYL